LLARRGPCVRFVGYVWHWYRDSASPPRLSLHNTVIHSLP
jgi:hypothetical protein